MVDVNIPANIISGNYLENTCKTLDDCGAIYTSGRNGEDPIGFADKTQIKNNIIVNSLGNANGRPAGSQSSAQGIYLDDYSNGPVVTGNTVINADHGIQVHNGSNITMNRNTLFANRQDGIWMQENSISLPPPPSCIDSSNCIVNNTIQENIFFPRISNVSVLEQSGYPTTADFAYYNFNRYSSLYSPYTLRERANHDNQQINNLYTLPQSQAVRSKDLNSTTFAKFGISPWLINQDLGVSQNSVTNSAFEDGISSWGKFPADSALSWEGACQTGNCLGFTASGSAASSIAISNRFSVSANKLYWVKFDIRSPVANSNIYAIIRKNGPGSSDYYLLAPSRKLSADANWRRYSFVLMATQNATDPSGGRLDFDVPTGQAIFLDNVEVREIATSNFITNPAFDLTDASGNLIGWGRFPGPVAGSTGQPAVLTRGACGIGNCLQFTAANKILNPTSLAISNPISLQNGRRYLVRFEAQASTPTETVVVLRRNGPSYESLTLPSSTKFKLGTNWQSFNIILTANGDALVGGKGRLDFEIPADTHINIDNVLVSEVLASPNDASDDSNILTNPGTSSLVVGCPSADSVQCSNYLHFWDGVAQGTPVSWPLSVPPKSSKIVVWATNPYRDSDFDGVADSNDLCSGTAELEPANEIGCSYTQLH